MSQQTSPFPPPPMANPATVNDGIELCRLLHANLISAGYFPALTGGLLYKNGIRKDIDIVIYRHRQDVESFEMIDIVHGLEQCGLSDFEFYGFVTKAKWKGITVDLFNPETKIEFVDGDYPG